MRSQVRFSLLALIAGAILVTPAPAAQAAFGVENFFAAECKVSTCKFTEAEKAIGFNQVVVYAGEAGDVPVEGTMYNLVQPEGLASDFGVALKLPISLTKAFLEAHGVFGKPAEEQYYAHTFIEGNVEWGAEAAGTGKADYHDYFEIKVSPALPLLSSRLVTNGRAPEVNEGPFLTAKTSCPGQTTTTLTLTPKEGPPVKKTYTAPGATGCELVPFNPGFELKPATKASDQADGLTTELSMPHDPSPTKLDSSEVNTATVTLPEGLTLNPSAAAGLEACTPEQIGIEKGVFVRKPVPHISEQVNCPEGSKLGTVTLNIPGLPLGSLQGNVFLGGPATGPITGPPYTIYVVAESERYGLLVRLKGETTPNETTGQLTTTFKENPEQPFSSLVVRFNKGPLAPFANPLKCEASAATALFTPFTNTAAKAPTAVFEVTGCAGTPPFSPTQSTSSEPA